VRIRLCGLGRPLVTPTPSSTSKQPASGPPSRGPRGHRIGLLRVGTSVVDQLVSNATNVIVVVIAAHSTTRPEFGLFALVYSLVTLVIGLSRALVSQPLLLFRAGANRSDLDRAPQASFAMLCLGSLIIGVALIPFPIVWGHWAIWGVLTVTMPLILIQDAGRYLFLASGLPKRALASDILWAVCVIGTFAALHVLDVAVTALVGLAVWLASGALAAVVPLLRWGLKVDRSEILKLIRLSREAGLRFLVEFGATTGAAQVILLLTGAIAGTAALGAFRAGFTVFGPINTLAASAAVAVLPELRKWVTRGRADYALKGSLVLGVALSAISGLWLAILLTGPGHEVTRLFGATSVGLRDVIPLLGVRYLFVGLSFGALTSLRAAGQLRVSMPIVVISSVVQVGSGVVLGETNGLHGILVALAVTEAATALALWLAALRRPGADLFSDPPPGALEQATSL
jgi:O-antigen/teichoic acid export membrane protein